MFEGQELPKDRERLSDLLREWLARGELDSRLGGRIWQALEAVVVAELRRRGLFAGPPRYLGIVGNVWQEPGAPAGGPMAELLSEVFVEAIARPLPRWQALLADPAANLEAGLVKAVRHAIHELQRRHDPLGYALYQRARKAVEQAVEAGQLFRVDSDSGKIGNAALLAGRAGAKAEPAPPAALAALVPSWLDELLPDLVTAVQERRQQAVDLLQVRLAGLAGEGIEAWRFKDLMDPLKAEVRARWQHRGRDDDGDLLAEKDEQGLEQLVRFIRPGNPQRIELEHLQKLLECVAGQIEKHSAQQRTLDHFWSLWGYLGTHADPASDEGRLPSARELERLLKIPREKIPSLLETLGRFLRLCQQLLSRLATSPKFAGGGSAR